MKTETREKLTCPECGMKYIGRPALSRKDNSLICPNCGTREALESIGVPKEEQDKIISIINSYRKV